jgi:hypothetical protein
VCIELKVVGLLSGSRARSPHEELKQWLLDLGKNVKDAKGKPYYKVYSGDSQPLDIRVRKRHITYQPDVVWERNGKLYLIELAFNEDWRAIVGELTAASALKNLGGAFIITYGWSDDYISDLMSLFGEMLDIWWAYHNFSEDEYSDINYMKKEIKKDLKTWKRI